VRTNELEGRTLDYWCARALVDDNEEVIFAEVEPRVVVTLTHDTLRKLAQPFCPSDEWNDAVAALERADELQWIRTGQGVRCRVRFGDGVPTEADGAHPRIALLRAFVHSCKRDSVIRSRRRPPCRMRFGTERSAPTMRGACPRPTTRAPARTARSAISVPCLGRSCLRGRIGTRAAGHNMAGPLTSRRRVISDGAPRRFGGPQ
jgi:hypothetical protein